MCVNTICHRNGNFWLNMLEFPANSGQFAADFTWHRWKGMSDVSKKHYPFNSSLSQIPAFACREVKCDLIFKSAPRTSISLLSHSSFGWRISLTDGCFDLGFLTLKPHVKWAVWVICERDSSAFCCFKWTSFFGCRWPNSIPFAICLLELNETTTTWWLIFLNKSK